VGVYSEDLLLVKLPEISPIICKYSAGSARALIISEKTCAEVFGTRVALGVLKFTWYIPNFSLERCKIITYYTKVY